MLMSRSIGVSLNIMLGAILTTVTNPFFFWDTLYLFVSREGWGVYEHLYILMVADWVRRLTYLAESCLRFGLHGEVDLPG